jgi:hypothetical protein
VTARLRAIIRARESSLIALAALIGLLGGLVVTLMGVCVDLLHHLFFQVPRGQGLSAEHGLNPLLLLAVPVAGGFALGMFNEFLKRWRPEGEIDPIEANALHGGRMSLMGSIIVGAQTVWSTGVGASVGLEAGYTQFASGIASRIDDAYFAPLRDLRLRPPTTIYLGLIHFTDGVAGTRVRLATARRFIDRFGVAAECGLGRRPPETIEELLRIHSAISDMAAEAA